MSAANTTNWNAVLKTLWRDELERIQFDESPFYAMVPKDTSWDGENHVVTIEYGGMNGRANSFSSAKSNKAPSKVKKMTITTSDNFGVWSVDGKLERLSRSNKGAVVRALEAQSRAILEKFKRSVTAQIFGNGGGAIGRAGTGSLAATDTVTLTSAKDARNFVEGDIVRMSSADGTSGSLRTGSLEVESVDLEAGTVTFTTNVTTGISAGAASDYFFIDGDHSSQGTGPLYGIDSYITPTVVTSSVWGMSRAGDSRLCGIRAGGKGLLVQEAITKALAKATNFGAKPDTIIMNPKWFNALDIALQAQRRYVDVKVGTVSFSGLEFSRRGGGKPIACFDDPDCPEDVVYILKLDTWCLHSAGGYPDFLIGGDGYLTEESANAREGRIGGYAQLYTVNPGQNCRLDMTATP